MKIKSSISFLVYLLAVISVFSSCDEDTATIGIIPDKDGVNLDQSIYKIFSKSIKVDSVMASTEDCYLGKITDPETNSTTSGDFLAQLYLLEGFSMPKKELMVTTDGKIEADSVDLRLYIKSYYGDSLNAMKIGVYELDTANVMREDKNYYTNIDADKYVNHNPSAIKKELLVSVVDLSIDDSIRNLSSYSKNIRVKLPKEYGTYIINQYYEHPEYFKNSYSFIRHVCPGFYVKTLSGIGTMMNVDISALSIYFRYNLKDSIYQGVQRMAATEEVLQNTHIENSNIEPLLNETEYTYIKTPAGIFTEITMPIDSIFNNEHYNDTLNSAKVVFQRRNNSETGELNIDIPSELLLIRKSEMHSFFENNKVSDGKTSFITTFNSNYNSYTFGNISNIISYCKNIRNTEAGVTSNDTPEVRRAKYDAWEAENPDWNKLILLPVTTTSNSSGTITKVKNNLWMTSTKLVGGNTGNITMSVIYSTFK